MRSTALANAASVADFQHLGVLDGTDRGGAGITAEQRHFSKRVSFAEHGQRTGGSRRIMRAVREDLHLAAPDDIERIAGVAGPEQNLPFFQLLFMDNRQNSLYLFGGQMAHQLARRQQFDPRLGIRLFARHRVFPKLGNASYGSAPLFQKDRGRIIKDGAGRKPGADKRPCRAGIVAAMITGLVDQLEASGVASV